MVDMQANDFWFIPLDWMFILAMMLVGIYSIIFNVTDAKRLNHPKSAQVARIGGWFYIMAAIGLFVAGKFFTF